jgi:uncharacterized membrane protein
MEWFYEKNGEQSGPISEAELQALFTAAELSASNLVWREGMTDWVTYGSVFASPAVATNVSRAGAERSAGSRRLREGNSNADLRAEARTALAGNWGIAVLIIFLSQLIQQIAGMLPIVQIFAPFFIAGPIMVGVHGCILGFVRRDTPEVSELFNGFQAWLKNCGLYLLTALIILFSIVVAAIPGGLLAGYAMLQDPDQYQQNPLFLIGVMIAVLCAVVVGTYFWLRYALVYFIANDEPEMRVVDILKRSRDMMQGQSSKFCWLLFSFTGWHILGLLTFGIGLLWSLAYNAVGMAAFYDDLIEGEGEPTQS